MRIAKPELAAIDDQQGEDSWGLVTESAWYRLALFLCVLGLLQEVQGWEPAVGPLKTRWAKDVSPANALPDYPRPQMVRKEWLNLNGLWEFALAPKETAGPVSLQTQILVPFPVESALSGIMRPVMENDRL